VAVLTREEETRWAEERQKSIERLIQDRGNNVRRVGALGRSPTSQASRSTQGHVVQEVTTKEGRGMSESRSTPNRPFEEEEKIVYKTDGRRVQERTRGHDVQHGPGHMQRISMSRVGYSATSSSSRR